MMEVSSSSSGDMEGIEAFNQSHGAGGSNPISASASTVSYRLAEESMQPSAADCEAYDQYFNLPELRAMWGTSEWAGWPSERLMRPALQALEMTFRLLSAVLCDSRPYVDKSEWGRRIESLAGAQLELIPVLLEDDDHGHVPTLQPSAGAGAYEVWQVPGASPVVSRTSKESLLPRLGTWKRAEAIVARIRLSIECHMQGLPFTLGIGEPNLAGKPVLAYDRICRPSYLYSLRQQQSNGESEAHTLRTVHQILEAWLFVAQGLLERVHHTTDRGDAAGAARDCWTVERVWKLLADTEYLLLLMDPDDFLRLRHRLAIAAGSNPGGGAYCLRSCALRNLTNACKELRHLVPRATGVQADPKGGPRLQEAVMQLFHSHVTAGTIHLLQALQAVEAAVKRFFFSYQQLVIAVMGSVEAKGSVYAGGASDALSLIYFEPPYFPSVDGAKTFLGDYWHYGPIAAAATALRTPEEPRRKTLQPTFP